VRAAVVVVDVVGEREDRLVVAVAVLERDLDLEVQLGSSFVKLTTDEVSVLPSLRNETYSVRPLSNLNASRFPTRSSSKTISTPALRNASSRRRVRSVSWTNCTPPLVSVKRVGSGLKVTLVPVLSVLPMTLRSELLTPRANSMW
jgi:hypothetical protein